MRINNNMSAVITNKQLLRTENNLTKSMERLSSGLKINHAKDNPAGMAISNKMQAQIDALDRASSNASDGTSVLQIADGALNETSAILQRMRELSVQAANGTNSLEDKQAIQDEIEALKDEVNRISKDTEYNSKSLLDGSLDTRVYTDNANVSRVNVSDYVNPGKYEINIKTAATKATDTATDVGINSTGTRAIGASGTISINGSSGTKVRQIQLQLARISQAYPAIPTITADGIFGERTREAVEAFQRIFDLPVSGVVDFPTWYKISQIYVGVTRIAELN